MSNRNRLPPWHEHFVLPNGRPLLVRPVRPEDEGPIHGVFALLGPDPIRHRFLPSENGPPPDLIQRLTHPNPKTELVLAAAEPFAPGEALVFGVARVALVPGTREAEFWVLVSRVVAGQGLGRHLMRKLVKWSRRKYLDRMYGDVPEDNQPMLQLADSLGFKRIRRSGAPGLVRMVLELGDG